MRRPLAVLLVCSAVVLLGLGQAPARATVASVSGGAYGYSASVSLFGSVPGTRGPTPTVALPSGGSAAPMTGSDPSGSVVFGPATFFSSGPLNVSTQGKTGAGGSVTSSANIQNVNTSQSEALTAASVASTCTASETASSRSTTITNGTLQTADGNPNVNGDETVVPIPANPAPNATYMGTVAGDSFRYVFNEQVTNADGSITVNAGHQYLLGPSAKGDLIIGQSRCGVNTVGAPPPTGGSDTTAPGVSSYRVTNHSFVVTTSSTPTFGSAARRRSKRGTTFKYTLSEAATVRIVISKRASGRRRGKRCVAPRRSLRKARKCTRLLRFGTLTRTSKAGANSVAFSGRIGSKALRPGSYSAAITATDAAKNTGRPKTISFVILRR